MALAMEPDPGDLARDIRFSAEEVTLAGTILIPDHATPRPAVVLISGGGPHDRDGSYGTFKPMKMLAEHLATLGIASLRYDDPGVGDSGGKDVMQYLMADYVAFVSAAVATLRELPNIDASRIGLLGLSQGSSVAAEVAAKDPRIAFIVLLSCNAVPGESLFLRYQRYLGQRTGQPEEMLDWVAQLQKAWFQCLRAGGDCAAQESAIKKHVRWEFDRWSAARRDPAVSFDDFLSSTFLGATLSLGHTPNFLEMLDYTILPAIGQVSCPVLIVFGAREEFMDVQTNLDLLKQTLASSGHRDFVTEIVPNATHLFLDPDQSDLSFSPGLLPCLTKWLTHLDRVVVK